MSKIALVFVSTLLAALMTSSTSEAKSISKYCTLLSAREIGRPVNASGVRASSVTLKYPALTGARGRMTICSHSTSADLIAQTSVTKFLSASGANAEFRALVLREGKQNHISAAKVPGPWTAGYFMHQDGFVALKGKFVFHIQYASGASGFANLSSRTLASLSARAVRKL